jgi:glycosyltransferase involved in cell wall biosynthesis
VNQTVHPYEIVISDDGSKDNTIKLVETFISKHDNSSISFKLVFNNNGHGVCKNFENAFKNTTGDVVFLCDQDDIWTSDKIEKMLRVFEERPENVAFHDAEAFTETNHEMMLLNYRLMKGIREQSSEKLLKIEKSKYLPAATKYCLIQGMCVCVRREYLMRILPLSRGANHDDWLLFCAQADDTIVALKEVLGYYRIHEHNTAGIGTINIRKRSLKERITEFDAQGKKNISGRYIWFNDVSDYLGESLTGDEKTDRIINYFSKERIELLSGKKVFSTIKIVRKLKEGVYAAEGKIVALHDIHFLWKYTRRYRRNYFERLEHEMRRNCTRGENRVRE